MCLTNTAGEGRDISISGPPRLSLLQFLFAGRGAPRQLLALLMNMGLVLREVDGVETFKLSSMPLDCFTSTPLKSDEQANSISAIGITFFLFVPSLSSAAEDCYIFKIVVVSLSQAQIKRTLTYYNI